MKSINKVILSNVETVLGTKYFKMSLFLMLLLSIYGGYLSSNLNYLEGFLSTLATPLYFVLAILIPFMVLSLCTYNVFEKNEYLILRLETRKEYLKNLVLTIFIVNLICFAFLLMVLIICMNLFPKSGFGFIYNEQLHCHNFLYLIFTVVKLFCIVQILSIISILLCKIIDKKIVISLNIALYISFMVFDFLPISVINSISKMPVFVGDYLRILRYGSFHIEFTCTILYILFLLILTCAIYVIVRKRIGDIKI